MNSIGKASIGLSLIFVCGLSCAEPPKTSETKKPIVVAVIDTGISAEAFKGNSLCKYGHRDFTGKGILDNHGHGTHISTLIDQYVKGIHPKYKFDPSLADELKAKKANYCQVIMKYYNDGDDSEDDHIMSLLKALRWAIDLKVDVINFSGGGVTPIVEERALIKEALDRGIKVIVAAGNERTELTPVDINKLPMLSCNIKTHICSHQEINYTEDVQQGDDPGATLAMSFGTVPKTYFPAEYDSRIIVVGNGSNSDNRAPSSNYGPMINTWENGNDVLSLNAQWMVVPMTGTSQSTAIKTGKVIKDMLLGR